MPPRVNAGYKPSSLAPWHSVTPKAVGAEGPVMSASSTPTRLPFRAMATASIEVTVDLPTPPLPDTTAMTFFTLAFGFSCASRLSALRSPQSELQLEQFPLQELMNQLSLSLRFLRDLFISGMTPQIVLYAVFPNLSIIALYSGISECHAWAASHCSISSRRASSAVSFSPRSRFNS